MAAPVAQLNPPTTPLPLDGPLNPPLQKRIGIDEKLFLKEKMEKENGTVVGIP